MALERLVVDADDSSIATPVVRDTVTGAFVVDYSDYYVRLSNAAELIASNLSTIKTKVEVIADNSTVIKEQLTTLTTNSSTLTTLAQTTGIHVIGPYDWLGLINVYRALVEQGKIMDTQGNVSEAEMAEALSKIAEYVSKLQAIPPGF